MTVQNHNTPVVANEQLERWLPAAKLAASVGGWANSLVTTILTCMQIQEFAYGYTSWLGFIFGVVLAVGLIVGQIFTLKRSRVWYAIFLFPDALMTSVQWCQWILFPVAFKLMPWLPAAATASVAGGVLGIISARMPEKLTFGK
ncbi:MAG TPA: hypothetical protein VGE07_23595 [Herpetosiphonaceae bacterium]